jgi:hypothetical protein
VRAVVRQAVRDVRAAPFPPPADPLADPALTELRRVVDDGAGHTHQLGELMLEVVPAYLSDTAAADVLAPLCEQISEAPDNGLAARRYAMSGDRRALYGTVLQLTDPGCSCVAHRLFAQVGEARWEGMRRGPAAAGCRSCPLTRDLDRLPNGFDRDAGLGFRWSPLRGPAAVCEGASLGWVDAPPRWWSLPGGVGVDSSGADDLSSRRPAGPVQLREDHPMATATDPIATRFEKLFDATDINHDGALEWADYERLTDLTRAMGITKTSMYAAFGNKEDLFRKAL